MDSIFLRNEKISVCLNKDEYIGEPRQSTFVDPLSLSGFVHEGYTVEELKQSGFVGVYMKMVDFTSDKFYLGIRNNHATD